MSTAEPTWQNPRPLRTALTTWACRSDIRDDPKARAAADGALAAIDATIAELTALRARVLREISDAVERRRADDARLAAAADEETCPATHGTADWQRCILPTGHHIGDGIIDRHVNASGEFFDEPVEASDDSGYHEAAELDHDEQIATATATLVAGGYPVEVLEISPEHRTALVRHPSGSEGWASLDGLGPLTGSQLAVLQARRLDACVTKCVHGYYSCPLCDEIVAPFVAETADAPQPANDADDWSDEELAALPPMFPESPGDAWGREFWPERTAV